MTGFKWDVFLNHSSEDKDVIRKLAERLRADGVRVWFDEWAIGVGQMIPAKIREGLEHSRRLVFSMSEHSLGSDWAELEQQAFRFTDPTNNNQQFVPLRLDDFELPISLKPFKFIDWRQRDETAYQELLELILRPKGEDAVRESVHPIMADQNVSIDPARSGETVDREHRLNPDQRDRLTQTTGAAGGENECASTEAGTTDSEPTNGVTLSTATQDRPGIATNLRRLRNRVVAALVIVAAPAIAMYFSSGSQGDFSTPGRTIETYASACKDRNPKLIRECFTETFQSPSEFPSFQASTDYELDRMAKYAAAWHVGEVEIDLVVSTVSRIAYVLITIKETLAAPPGNGADGMAIPAPTIPRLGDIRVKLVETRNGWRIAEIETNSLKMASNQKLEGGVALVARNQCGVAARGDRMCLEIPQVAG